MITVRDLLREENGLIWGIDRCDLIELKPEAIHFESALVKG